MEYNTTKKQKKTKRKSNSNGQPASSPVLKKAKVGTWKVETSFSEEQPSKNVSIESIVFENGSELQTSAKQPKLEDSAHQTDDMCSKNWSERRNRQKVEQMKAAMAKLAKEGVQFDPELYWHKQMKATKYRLAKQGKKFNAVVFSRYRMEVTMAMEAEQNGFNPTQSRPQFKPKWAKENAQKRSFLSGQFNQGNLKRMKGYRKPGRMDKEKSFEDYMNELRIPTILVQVVPEGYPSIELTEEQTHLVQSAFIDAIISLENSNCVKLHETFFENGALVLKCINQETVEWVCSVTPNLTPWEGAKLISIRRVRPEIKVVLKIPRLLVDIELSQLTAMLARQNPKYDVPNWRILSNTKDADGQTLVFAVNYKQLRKIKNNGLYAFFALFSIPLSVGCMNENNSESEDPTITDILKPLHKKGRIVFIRPKDYPNIKFNVEQEKAMQSALIGALMSIEDSTSPQFISFHFNEGFMVLKCNNKETVEWVCSITPSLSPWEGAELESGPFYGFKKLKKKCVLKLPSKLADTELTKLTSMLVKQNPTFDIPNWTIFRDKSDSQTLICMVDNKELKNTKAANPRVSLALWQIPLIIQSLRKAKHHTNGYSSQLDNSAETSQTGLNDDQALDVMEQMGETESE